MKKYVLLGALVGTLTPLAFAETEISLDEIVITATRIEQPLKQTLSSTTVITQEEIKNSLAADVSTILRNVAGVEISQTGGLGKSSALFLRGSESTQVLVLLDGVRINSATLGTTSIEHLMLDQIERIEIVRGNVSSLYGSEAIGGVVQIFTKHGKGEPKFNLSAGVGSYGTQRLATGFGGAFNNTEFNLQLSHITTDGISSINPGLNSSANPDKDGYDNSSVSANIRHSFNTDHSLAISMFNSQGRNQYDSAYGPSSDVNYSTNQVNKVSLVSDNRFTESWKSTLLLAKGVDSYLDYTNGVPTLDWMGQPSSKFLTENRQLNWQNTIQLDIGKQLLTGFEYLNQQVSSDIVPAYTETERSVNSSFVGYTGNYGQHQIQTNLRRDQNSQYGIASTGLIGYGYKFSEFWRATTSYSTGFRAPSFNELYYPNYGNTALRPEQSRNIEAGIHYSILNHNVDLVYFDNRTKNLIIPVEIDPINYIYQAQNVNEARIDGVEISYAGSFSDTSIKAAVVLQNPRDLTSNKPLDRRASTHSNLAVTHKLDTWELGSEWLYSDSRSDKNNTKTLADYHVFNISVAYTVSKQLKASLRADNLTDQNNANAYSYNPLGRTFFVNLHYQQ